MGVEGEAGHGAWVVGRQTPLSLRDLRSRLRCAPLVQKSARSRGAAHSFPTTCPTRTHPHPETPVSLPAGGGGLPAGRGGGSLCQPGEGVALPAAAAALHELLPGSQAPEVVHADTSTTVGPGPAAAEAPPKCGSWAVANPPSFIIWFSFHHLVSISGCQCFDQACA